MRWRIEWETKRRREKEEDREKLITTYEKKKKRKLRKVSKWETRQEE